MAASLENVADKTMSSWPRKVCLHIPVSLHQILAVQSEEPVKTNASFIENTADRTGPSWPCRVCKHSPTSDRFQILAVPSSEEVRMVVPPHETTTCVTRFSWPLSVSTQSPFSMLQTWTLSPCDVTTNKSASRTSVSCAPSSTPSALKVMPGINMVPLCSSRNRGFLSLPNREIISLCISCTVQSECAARGAISSPASVTTDMRMTSI
mmetsp:Transcript_144069/g.359195  ORF Transcript_144069/g.359195 Transcript_144069/m.359195 type:complete len:208 (+) Transcript_144069:683-1306(+)